MTRYSGLLGCEAVLLDKQFPKFGRIVVHTQGQTVLDEGILMVKFNNQVTMKFNK